MQTGLVAAAPAVHDGTVAQGYLLYTGRREMTTHHFPQKEGIAGTAAAGVKSQDVAPPFRWRGKGNQFLYELADAFLIGPQIIDAPYPGLYGEIVQ